MDQDALALAGAAGTTLVTLMATDAWAQARQGVVSLWQRFRPHDAPAVDELLSRSREALLAGEERSGVESEWQLRIGGLLAQSPEAVAGLASLLRELNAGRGSQVVSGTVHFEARADGSGTIYQSLRDQTVNNHS